MPPCTQRPCDVSIACVTLVETSIFCLYVLSPDVMPCLPTSISSATEYRKGTKRNLRNAYWLPNSILFCFFPTWKPTRKAGLLHPVWHVRFQKAGTAFCLQLYRCIVIAIFIRHLNATHCIHNQIPCMCCWIRSIWKIFCVCFSLLFWPFKSRECYTSTWYIVFNCHR